VYTCVQRVSPNRVERLGGRGEKDGSVMLKEFGSLGGCIKNGRVSGGGAVPIYNNRVQVGDFEKKIKAREGGSMGEKRRAVA